MQGKQRTPTDLENLGSGLALLGADWEWEQQLCWRTLGGRGGRQTQNEVAVRNTVMLL